MEKDKKIISFIGGDQSGEREDGSTMYFKSSFDAFEYKGAPIFSFQWNWMAFLFGPFYLMYRRRYWESCISLIGTMILSFAFLAGPVLNALLCPWAIYQGYRRAKAKAEKYFPDNEADQLVYLSKVGGVDKRPVIVLGIVVGVLVALILLVTLVIGAAASSYRW